MKLKALIVGMMVVFLGTTTFAMAEATASTQAPVVDEEDTWFGDSYEEDGCFCN